MIYLIFGSIDKRAPGYWFMYFILSSRLDVLDTLLLVGNLYMTGSIRFDTEVLSSNPESIYGNEGVLVFINLKSSADVFDELIISGNT